MPELPEVQTIVSDLQTIAGDEITGFWTNWEKAIFPKTKEKKAELKTFEKIITGQKILAIKRIGKYIVFALNNNYSLLIHLRMTGQLLVKSQISNLAYQQAGLKSKQNDFPAIAKELNRLDKHAHHIFFLKNKGSLVFHDIRKFGTINLLKTSLLQDFKNISVLGLDPTLASFTLLALQKILKTKEKRVIKDLLLDQTLISGIGNIYASEILFDAKINPLRKTKTLTETEIKTLHSSIKKILQKAIRLRGTSVSDYRDSKGKKGTFQNVLMVYKKNGQECKKCGTMIAKIIIGQRSTFFCPNCQH